jgi:SpoVK/Ycf46/Vps4 family AAA+-type ATPase
LNRLRPNNQFNFQSLASGSKDFSGAEIEQVIYDAMQFGFSQNREFTTEDILDSIADCIPLAKIASHQIEALKDWASRSGAKSASLSPDLDNNLLPLLEVDYQEDFI